MLQNRYQEHGCVKHTTKPNCVKPAGAPVPKRPRDSQEGVIRRINTRSQSALLAKIKEALETTGTK
jgi:hypothetical protein